MLSSVTSSMAAICLTNIKENIKYMVSNQDKCIKMVGETEYFRLLNILIDANKNNTPAIIKAEEYLKLGGDC